MRASLAFGSLSPVFLLVISGVFDPLGEGLPGAARLLLSERAATMSRLAFVRPEFCGREEEGDVDADEEDEEDEEEKDEGRGLVSSPNTGRSVRRRSARGGDEGDDDDDAGDEARG